MKAIILAAGRGERLRPLTDHTPKPLIQIKGESIISRHLRALAAVGIQEVVINISHLAEQIKTALGDGQAYGLKIHYSYEPVPLETGGGIFNALPLLGTEPFLVINGDIITDYPFQNLMNKPISGLAHLVLIDNPSHNPTGDFYLSEGVTLPIGEPKLTLSGIYLCHPDLFLNCVSGVFPIAPLLRKAIAAGQVTGEYYSGNWIDIGHPEHLDKFSN